MRILDATAGTRSIWYQKKCPFAVFMDKRSERVEIQYKGNGGRGKKTCTIKPDIIADWTKPLPFDPESFDMVLFDPPHLLKDKDRPYCIMNYMYGHLDKNSWRSDLRAGIRNLFSVLKDEGVFIFKWSERDISLDQVLKLFPYRPLFGTRTGQRNSTHWIVFVKHRVDGDIMKEDP